MEHPIFCILKRTGSKLSPFLRAALCAVSLIAWGTQGAYDEPYRPQFHFSPARGFFGDPNGPIYHNGVYHLFYQHNPNGTGWSSGGYPGNMYWGHAVSTDLVRWREMPIALSPNMSPRFDPWSGNCIADRDNVAGLRKNSEEVLIAFLTAHLTGRQIWAVSHDSGYTWQYDLDNYPIMEPIEGSPGARDPKVFWHEPSQRWVMTLLVEPGAAIFTSTNLKQWTRASDMAASVANECPDLFELRVDGNPGNTKWISTNGWDKVYHIGRFDGASFTVESGPHRLDLFDFAFNTLSFTNMPASDGRCIGIDLLSVGEYYSGQVWGQQAGFPSERTLRTFPEGIRMCQNPVREIANLRRHTWTFTDVAVPATGNLLQAVSGTLLDIEGTFATGSAGTFGFRVRDGASGGTTISYNRSTRQLSVCGKTVSYTALSDTVRMRILVDWNSVEVFMDEGRARVTACHNESWGVRFKPAASDSLLAFFVSTNPQQFRVVSLGVHLLSSSWDTSSTQVHATDRAPGTRASPPQLRAVSDGGSIRFSSGHTSSSASYIRICDIAGRQLSVVPFLNGNAVWHRENGRNTAGAMVASLYANGTVVARTVLMSGGR